MLNAESAAFGLAAGPGGWGGQHVGASPIGERSQSAILKPFPLHAFTLHDLAISPRPDAAADQSHRGQKER